MKSLVSFLLTALCCAVGIAAPPAPAEVQDAKQAPSVYDEKADGKEQIAEALVEAKRNHRRVMIQWGANWCGWCVKLDGLFKSDPKVRHELSYEYDVVHIDVGQFDKHMDLAKSYGLTIKAVPHLTILDEDGKLVANVDTTPLETKNESGLAGHDPKLVLAMLEKHRAPQAQARPLLRKAIDQARTEQKRVFLIFGAPW